MRFRLLLATLLLAAPLANAVQLSGRILYQPQFLWANSESSVQGTGFFVTHQGKLYGVTTVHDLPRQFGGLVTATWLDVATGEPLATFRASVGRPLRTRFTEPQHYGADFILLVPSTPPDEVTALSLESVAHYASSTAIRLPLKADSNGNEHEWVSGMVEDDQGHTITVVVRHAAESEAVIGSPVLNADSQGMIGLVAQVTNRPGATTLLVCPARSILAHLKRRPALQSLQSSLRSGQP